ncbi:ATP-dependent nuclease [Clostridium estertheticum]|uniref:ATP-dependent nuclease n=1 Tax=Clostridium estertheticum TaxID=238834 RepID=UPI001C0ABD18|nr:AAA family ATPase [Clostridium estertheticum]MBU3183246.1 AAA family ATPase [Clostridium estertheticum]
MRLKKVKISNFRSFGKEEQQIYFDDLTAFIGNNSAGKTAALQALLKVFSDSSNDRVLYRSDFHLPKNVELDSLTEEELYIEAIFDFPELISEDGSSSAVPTFWEQFVVEQPGAMPYLRIRLEASWEKGSSIDGSIESNIYYIVCPEATDILEENRKRTNRHVLDKIRMIYVPAVRDPSKQLKNVSGTMLYRIMESVNWSETTKTAIDTKIGELNVALVEESGVSILKDAIKTQWKEYGSDHRYTNAEMQFINSNMDAMLKKSEVVFSPTVTGREYKIDEMGDGLRSLFYISMVDSMLEVENEIRSQIERGEVKPSFNLEPPIFTIVALEEPENHIAPHLVGKLVKKFLSISKKDCVQTIIASHSTAIIKRIDPESIRYFRLNEVEWSTVVKVLNFPDKESMSDKYKYVKEAVRAYPEIYFARLVVLGEGDSEEIVLPKFIELMGREIDSSGISIVPLGGRHVNHFWRLLYELEIPFVTLLDLDRERDGGGWGRIKYVLVQLIKYGIDRNTLLKTTTGIMTQETLDNMHNWKMNISLLEKWVQHLENNDVYFSSPLDLDFMLLESYGELYKNTLDDNKGPRIIKKGTIKELELENPPDVKYVNRIAHDIGQTLKENGGDGSSYTSEQQKLMIWYNYFFLNRGKPTTHFQAMSQIDDEKLIEGAPDVIKRVIARINLKLNDTIGEL